MVIWPDRLAQDASLFMRKRYFVDISGYMDINFLIAKEIFLENLPNLKEIEGKYPERMLNSGAFVTRFAPSPTGFMHIGGLFASLISERIAHQTGGIFYLRIEDTDKKREVEGAVKIIVDTFSKYSINLDEGETSIGKEIGLYGPYRQSKRLNIYSIFAKYLIENDLAYPCFCTGEELQKISDEQIKEKIRPGYYSKWATCRNIGKEDTLKKLKNHEPYVIRLKSNGDFRKKVYVSDLVKGNIELSQNDLDIVLIKSDGFPTYHFAHIVDDHLMGTTHVIRGDEWLSSTALHIELWRIFGWNIPKYGHISPIQKREGESRRKLSKRKDPEANIEYYEKMGYPPVAVIEYLINLANSNFEDWRRLNPNEDYKRFILSLNKLNKSGALFDEIKLMDISKDVISRMSLDERYSEIIKWLEHYDGDFRNIVTANPDYFKKILSIENDVVKRKDLRRWSDIKNNVDYFFDALFPYGQLITSEIKKETNTEDIKKILSNFIENYDSKDNSEQWFAKIKELASKVGYAQSLKDYKNEPTKFKGYVGNVAQIIRVALTGKTKTPDLYQIMVILGEKIIKKRIMSALNTL